MLQHHSILLVLLTLTSTTVWGQSIINPAQELRQVRADFEMADGAAWDGISTLYVPDVKGQVLYGYSPKQDKWWKRLPNAGRISATFYQLGHLYLSDHAGARILRCDRTGEPQLVAQFGETERPNDLVVDHHGGVYVTLTRQGQVRYIGLDGSVTVAAEGLLTPNGIILSPDCKTLYVSQHAARNVVQLKVVSPGKIEAQKLFAEMKGIEERGADGMTVDRAGNIYCCGPDGVWVWDPAGQLKTKIATPSKAINCSFGGDGRSLYISTQQNGLYECRMLSYGREPHPPSINIEDSQKNRPSTAFGENISAHLDVVYANKHGRKLLTDIFVPKGRSKQNRACLIIVHGGGWLKGDKTKFRALSLALAERQFVIASIEYRLGHEAKFPAAIEDCAAAVQFLKAHASEYGIDPDRIGAVGGSAGGHLVGLLAAAPPKRFASTSAELSKHDASIAAAAVMAGPLQIASGSVAERSLSDPNSNANLWIGKTIEEAPDAYKAADALTHISSKTPPILFLVGSKDNPQRNEPARKRLKEFGVPTHLKVYPDAKHGAWNQLPWFEEFVRDIDGFMKQHL